MYNQTQRNLLLAEELTKQSRDRIDTALMNDEGKDEPELRPHLRKMQRLAKELQEMTAQVREHYDETLRIARLSH